VKDRNWKWSGEQLCGVLPGSARGEKKLSILKSLYEGGLLPILGLGGCVGESVPLRLRVSATYLRAAVGFSLGGTMSNRRENVIVSRALQGFSHQRRRLSIVAIDLQEMFVEASPFLEAN